MVLTIARDLLLLNAVTWLVLVFNLVLLALLIVARKPACNEEVEHG